jgi:nitroreductase
MELDEAMTTTASVRDYTGEPLPDDVLYAILDKARFAPSGGNRQGAHVVIVRDPATRQQLASFGEAGARRYLAQVAAGENPWNTVHPTSVSPQQIAATEILDHFVQPFLDASVVLVVSLDLSVAASLDQDLDRVGLVAGASVYPLVWNILLAARQAGFGGTITTVAIAQEPEVKELLGLPAAHAVAALMPLGRPVRQVRRLTRKPVSDFVSCERFDGPAFEPR